MDFISKYETQWGSPERLFEVKTGDWRHQRPVMKVDKCSQCGWCYLYCPTGCIVDFGTYFRANLDYCKGCGVCARECPVNAITMVKEDE